ncbi:MAG: HD domain-containing protein [Firmicutes bacterium]|nr:HD domain-containing protein [Bacillota bacterium]
MKVGELYVASDLGISYASSWDDVEAVLQGISTLVTSAIDRNIPAGSTHSQRVAGLAASIAEKLGLPSGEIRRIYFAGLFHDFGKLFLPSNVLIKTEPLSEDDWSFIELHPQLGATFLERVPPFSNIANDVLHHHERIDGRGYPRRLSGEDIPLGARIIAVVESFDAMTASDSYRACVTHEIACDTLIKGSGTQFDGGVVQAFLAVLSCRKQ